MRRRRFLVTLGGAGASLAGSGAGCRPSTEASAPGGRAEGSLGLAAAADELKPLDVVVVDASQPGLLLVTDGDGITYVRREVERGESEVALGGALGTHHILLLDAEGHLLDRASVRVDAHTELVDGSGQLADLLATARYTLQVDYGRLGRHVRIAGRVYHHLVYWLRDHVYTAEGGRWFQDELRSGIDLYADLQREDGMIWDNVEPRPGSAKTWWAQRFGEGDFVRAIDEGRWELKRIPVTNDVEACFVDGLWVTWQATGDDPWMAGHLDAAARALLYSVRDPLRWSSKHELLRRGFTIDQWDFLADGDADDTGDAMVVKLGVSELGVMFGDNHQYARACRRLALMLEAAGRAPEAAAWRERAAGIMARTDALAWTGTHYRMHVPEEPGVERDLGVDQAAQVSLSNAYALDRGIEPERAAAIIATYKGLRDDHPPGAPGEWYSIVPPFARGFSPAAPPWEYVNGGVIPIVAGRLALGAFAFGEERYGVDILRRVRALADRSDGVIEGAYRGAIEPPPPRTFVPLPLQSSVNASHPPAGATSGGAPFATGGGGREVVLAGARFELSPGEPAGAVVLGRGEGRRARMRLAFPGSAPCGSLYLLHEAEGDVAGALTFHYASGPSATVTIDRRHYGDWWHEPEVHWPDHRPASRMVWRSDDAEHFASVWVVGIANPHPERRVRHVSLEASLEGRRWTVLAISACDAAPWFPPGLVSYGIPVGWGASAVVSAIVEGLGGVQDHGAGLRAVTIAPRWAAAGEPRAELAARYADGRGYVSYRYRWDDARRRLHLTVTGSGDDFILRVLLPPGFSPEHAKLNGTPTPVETTRVGESVYARAHAIGRAVHTLVLRE